MLIWIHFELFYENSRQNFILAFFDFFFFHFFTCCATVIGESIYDFARLPWAKKGLCQNFEKGTPPPRTGIIRRNDKCFKNILYDASSITEI